MILLDTDHLTVLAFPGDSRHPSLVRRMTGSSDPRFALPLISVEEQMRGWLAEIHRERDIHRQLRPYARLAGLIAFWHAWEIVPFEEQAANIFAALRDDRIRIGTQDLKIAAIALTLDALLLSANLRDFQKVPGLRLENWLE